MKNSRKAPVAAIKNSLSTSNKSDDFDWLRAKNWQDVMRNPELLAPDIKLYLDQENTYADTMLKHTQTLQKTLFQEMKGRIQEDESSIPEPEGKYEYYARFEKAAQYPLYCRKKRNRSKNLQDRSCEEVLFDFNAMGKKHVYFDMGGVARSFSHQYMAYAIDAKGSEYYTIRFRDTETGRDLSDVLYNTDGSLVWAKDDSHVFYITFNDNHRADTVWRHKMGAKQKEDTIVYKEKDPGWFLRIYLSESEEYIFIVSEDYTTSETHMIKSHQPLKKFTVIARRQKSIRYSVTHCGKFFYIKTNADNAIDFKIIKTPIETPGMTHWQDYIPHKNGVLRTSISINKNYLVRLEIVNALPRIVVKELDTGVEDTIQFFEQAYALNLFGILEFDEPIMRFSYCSPTTQTEVYDYHMQKKERTLRKRQAIPSGHRPENYETKRIFVTAHDESKVPLTIVYKKGLLRNNSNPVLLYGYGSYGLSIPASFSTSRLSLLDRGFVYAIAHVRGGMDCGYRWWTKGKMQNKKNTFLDFLACGQALVDQGYTKIGKITAMGGSAGGLLMGAVVNMRPSLFKSIVALVPFVDVLNTICDETLPLTPPEWKEWGNPNTSRTTFAYIESYSPYDNVKKQLYPNIYVQAGLTDPRVTYWEPAKWVAKLRRHNTNENALIVLRTQMKAGHSGISGRFDALRETAEIFAFIIDNK